MSIGVVSLHLHVCIPYKNDQITVIYKQPLRINNIPLKKVPQHTLDIIYIPVNE